MIQSGIGNGYERVLHCWHCQKVSMMPYMEHKEHNYMYVLGAAKDVNLKL